MEVKKVLILLGVVFSLFLTVKMALGAVLINEMMPTPASGNDWAEIYNNESSAADIGGWKFNDSTSEISGSTIASGTSLAGGGYLVVELGSRLNVGGDEVKLIDNSGGVVDNYTYASSTSNVSIGRLHDGLANWVSFTTATRGATNNRLPANISALDQVLAEDVNGSVNLSTVITDGDGDSLTFSVTSQNTAQVGCGVSGDNLTLIPAANYNGSASCTVQANDGYGGVVDFAVGITVNPVNDLPVIGAMANQQGVQEIRGVYSITATDVDNGRGELSISASASSLPTGMTVSTTDNFSLVWTPTESQLGVNPVGVVVTDGQGNSLPANFNITVVPALEVVESELTVKGVAYNGSVGVGVNPGEAVTVRVGFKNNYNRTLGHIGVNLSAFDAVSQQNIDSLFEGLPHQGDCQGSDCEQGQWVLQPGSSGAYTFSFGVPYSLMGNFFLRVGLEDRTIDPSLEFDDSANINFNLVREEAAIRIINASLADENLTCTKETELRLELANTGQFAITPEVLVYSRSREGASFNESNGKFVFSEEPAVALDFTLSEMAAGGSLSQEIVVNGVNLTGTSGTLYIYVVNPYFNSSGYYVGASTTVNINKLGACLNKTALEAALKTYQNTLAGKSVNLWAKDSQNNYLYLDEDVNYESSLGLVIDSETNSSLVDCNLVSGVITCGAPAANWNGRTGITLNITEGGSRFQEVFEVEVGPSLEISQTRISSSGAGFTNTAVSEGGVTPALNPLDSFELSFTLINHLSMAVTGITVSLVDNQAADGYTFNFGSLSGINLEAGGSSNLVVQGTVPYDVGAGNYSLALSVSGTHIQDDSTVGDRQEMILQVAQEVEGMMITNVSWVNNKSETYCDQNLGLEVRYTNTGPHTENDIGITVSDGTGAVNLSSGILGLGSGSQSTALFNFNTTGLAEGTHTLNVGLSYNNGHGSDTKTASLVKRDCFAGPTVSIPEDTADTGIAAVNLANQSYTSSQGVSGLNEAVVYGLVSQSNSTLVNCGLSSVGMLSCGNLYQDGTGSSVLNITLTSGSTVNEEQVTVTVSPVNDAPVILLGDFSFMEDQYYQAALNSAVSDVDNAVSGLVFTENAVNLSLEKTAAGNLKFTAASNWYGTESFNLTVSDGVNTTSKLITATVGWNQTDDSASLAGRYPAGISRTVKEDENLVMNVTVSNPDQMGVVVKWYVNNTEVGSGQQHTFNAGGAAGTYTVMAKLFFGSQQLGTEQWTITAVDRPADINTFGGSATTNLGNVSNVGAVSGFTLENSYGKVVFNQANLNEIVSLAEVVKIQNKLVAVNASGLSGPATITLYNTGLSNPLVKKTTQFTTDGSLATTVTTINATAVNGAVSFNVDGFSTYIVVEDVPADLVVPTSVVFDLAGAGVAVEKNFTVSNVGAREGISNIQISSQAASSYGVAFYDGNVPLTSFSLGAGANKVITVKGVVPTGATGGTISLGTVSLAYGNVTKTVPLSMQVSSLLEITSIKLNGRSGGEFEPGEENTVEVEVRNNGQTEIEDVTIVVTVEDIDDGDDLDEESDEFDLGAGEEEEEELNFDVDGDLDEDDYEVTVEVEVDGQIVTTETKEFEVERENHQVVIESTSLPSTIYCNKYPTLYVNLENRGRSDEDEVKIKIISEGLGLNVERGGIELDDYSDEDNDYRASFNLDLNQAVQGTYQILVEVYRDDDELEDSKTLSLTVGECVSTYQAQAATPIYSAQEIAAQMEQGLSAGAVPAAGAVSATAVRTSFRESDTYLVMLMVLVVLVFVAVILGLVVVLKKK